MIFIAIVGKTSQASGGHTAEPAAYSCAISVIIPVYNTESYLRECLDSILGQSFRDFELICVDDESSDQSLLVLRGYESADARVKVFPRPHGGLSATRNFGLRMAGGKYIYFMDSDDKLADGALGTMHALIEERDADILYFDGAVFFETEELAETYRKYAKSYRRPVAYREVVTGAEMFARLYNEKAYEVSACLQILKHEYLKSIGLNFYEGIIYEDNLFTLKSLLQAGRVSHENALLFLRRVRGGSIVTSAVTYRNFASYFICWNEMTAFALARPFKGAVRKALNKHIYAIRARAIENGAALPDSEIEANMEKEPPLRRTVYRVAFRANIVRRRRENAGARGNGLSKMIHRIQGGVEYRMGQAALFASGGMKRTGGH